MAHIVYDRASPWDEPVEDGVYLGYPHIRYFRQETRGSSDWIDIHRLKHGWWWKSVYNPYRRRAKSTAEQTYGSALHALILEGEEAYERQFLIRPSKEDYVDLLVTIDEIRAAMEKAGYTPAPKGRYDLPGWADQASQVLANPIWHLIDEDFKARAGDLESVSAADDYEMRFLREMALSEDRNDNEQVRRLFTMTDGHPPLVEVSIFATIDGIRRRWRIDRLFPAANMDLKSLGTWTGRPLTIEAGEILARRRWSIQRADYDMGRRVLYRLVEAGKVYGGTLEERRYLESIVAHEPKWDWVWMIYQKPDSVRGTAPILMPVWDDAGSPLCVSGAAKLDASIRFYKAQVAAWGLSEPWGRVERLHYATQPPGRPDLPALFVPNYEFDRVDDPTEAEAYEGADG